MKKNHTKNSKIAVFCLLGLLVSNCYGADKQPIEFKHLKSAMAWILKPYESRQFISNGHNDFMPPRTDDFKMHTRSEPNYFERNPNVNYPANYTEWKDALSNEKSINYHFFTDFQKDNAFAQVISTYDRIATKNKYMHKYTERYKTEGGDVLKKLALDSFDDAPKLSTQAQLALAAVTNPKRKAEAEDCMPMIQEKMDDCRKMKQLLAPNNFKLIRQRALTGKNPMAYRIQQKTF